MTSERFEEIKGQVVLWRMIDPRTMDQVVAQESFWDARELLVELIGAVLYDDDSAAPEPPK